VSVHVDVDLDEAVLAELVADIVGDMTTEVANAARRRCPVDNGQLRASIRSQVITHGSETIGEVYSDLEYAAYVHEGTGIYGPSGRPIRPVRARVLSWQQRGVGRVYAREVRGQRPQPFLANALAEVVPGRVDRSVRY
jgi:hypothetical protein